MRNVILQEFVTIDGLAASPDDSVAFVPASTAGDQSFGHAPWGEWDDATIVRGSVAQEVAKLKQQAGKDMVIWGSISLAQSCMKEGLIDEYQLIVCPVVLGSGKRLFRDRVDSLDMTLLNTKSFDRGTVLLTYAAAKTTAAADKP